MESLLYLVLFLGLCSSTKKRNSRVCKLFYFTVFFCHFSDKTWATVYQKHYSAIPKKEDGKKTFWEQSQLLDGMVFTYGYI